LPDLTNPVLPSRNWSSKIWVWNPVVLRRLYC
jgi:hypothetical protein